ncbi:leucyl aminopeptidase [Ovoidimarina sediminis]|uniref:leucyl aminopeptidase n=1 Tax=Ovoidimarina sediminis TaxID=3079856 RepID=UPI00290675E6|nr:leucyl aminopeptidase [Rhodophyticola sp. MJ-SS7]MDU8945652.1 leucyl aminopeptidase [Rhodophyticola sp. MJ-SS7]
MTETPSLAFTEIDLDSIASAEGRVAVFISPSGKLDQTARRVNRLTRGALERFAESKAFAKLREGEARDLAWPTGLAAEALQVVKLDRRPDGEEARKAGIAIGRAARGKSVLVLAGNIRGIEDLALGALLRAYDFTDHRSKKDDDAGDDGASPGSLTFMCSKPEEAEAAAADVPALAQGVFFTRDLVNAPSNVLTTTAFADTLKALSKLGAKVTVLEEDKLEKLGMRALLGVGQGSESPSKVVVIEWNGGGKGERPFALVGKGVVFDTGGISLKPAGGMEDMTMDMGGAGVVAGVMKALALRKAKANVVGLVGLVENMPDGRAQRPGDVVTSMKGDTIEVINTDAEGRLVLCDVIWYAQETYDPVGMVDLATLTGAIIIGLGHENAGVFSNDDNLCEAFLAAARAEGEGAWRMPLGDGYDKQLKSRIADMKNVGGRPAGSITAAQFLKRFVKDETPWIHLDIAGVASLKTEGPHAPKGATGWGVLALNRLIADRFETGS